jgi:hypothetical protein
MNDDVQNTPEFNPGNNQPTTIQWIIIAVVGLGALCGIALFLSGSVFTIFALFEQEQFQANQVITTPTMMVDQNQLDYQAAANWPLLMLDAFNDNQNEWIDGEIDDAYAQIFVSIDGVYTWNVVDSKQGFTWRVWPAVDSLTDFYLAVDAQNRSDNADAQYGLIFRNQEDDYYYFEVRDAQHFRFFLYEAEQWKELLPYTYTDAIIPGGINRLAVVSQANRFTLWINDQYVGEAYGSSPAEGQVGVIIGHTAEGEESFIAFDNFEVRVPELPE